MPATKTAFISQPVPIAGIPTFLTGQQAEELEAAIYEKIRQRAYLLFEESGRAPGNEDVNWLQAESQVLHVGLDVCESATWVSLNAPIPAAAPQGIQIAVLPQRVVVRATAILDVNSPAPVEDEGTIFLAANLSVEVDPQTAAASFRDHALRVIVRKQRPSPLTAS